MAQVVVGSVRSRREGRARRLSRRWSTIVIDYFDRINGDSLGDAATGHGWSPFVNATDWAIRSGQARLRASTVGNKERARVQSGLSDGTILARINVGSAASNGVGISFRETSADNAWTFHYLGGTSWRWSRWSGSSAVSNTAVTGPTLTLGVTYEFKVVLAGDQVKGYLDGVQVGATQTISANQTETIHGIFADGSALNLFEQFKIHP